MIPLLITLSLLAQADGTIVRRRDVQGTGSTVVPTTIQTTSANTTYYVTSSGSDSATCLSASTPCLTIQGALGKIPKNIYHQIDVSVGAGNFAGFSVEGFSIHSSNQSTQPYLNISGTLSAFTPATGSSTGTLTAFSAGSGATFAIFTDGGANWTVNDLKGRLLQITSGTGATSSAFYVITSNTQTAITALAGTSTAAAAGSGYAILTWGTTITTPLAAQTSGPSVIGSATTNWRASGVRVSSNFAEGAAGNALVFQKLAFAFGSSGNGFSLYGSTRTVLQWNKFGTNVTAGVQSDHDTWIYIGGSYFSAIALGVIQPIGAAVFNGGMVVNNTFFENGAVGLSPSTFNLNVAGCLFKGQSNAAITGSFFSSIITTSRIDGAAWGIKSSPISGSPFGIVQAPSSFFLKNGPPGWARSTCNLPS